MQAFTTFLNQLENEKEKLGDLQLQRTAELLNLDILERQRTIATLSIDKIDAQLDAIDDQQRVLNNDMVIGSLRSIIEGAATGGGIGGVSSGLGVAANIFHFLDQE